MAGLSPASTACSASSCTRPSSPSARGAAPEPAPGGLGPAEVVVLDAGRQRSGGRDRAAGLVEVVAACPAESLPTETIGSKAGEEAPRAKKHSQCNCVLVSTWC